MPASRPGSPDPSPAEHRTAMATSVHNSLSYIRNHYGVPAQLDARVRYTGGGTHLIGTIVGTSGAHLMILIDGEQDPTPFHPTWQLEYLGQEQA